MIIRAFIDQLMSRPDGKAIAIASVRNVFKHLVVVFWLSIIPVDSQDRIAGHGTERHQPARDSALSQGLRDHVTLGGYFFLSIALRGRSIQQDINAKLPHVPLFRPEEHLLILDYSCTPNAASVQGSSIGPNQSGLQIQQHGIADSG